MSFTIRSRAPLRITFAGGGTDVEPYPSMVGGAVINAAIDRYAYASLHPSDKGYFTIYSQDYDMQEEIHDASEVVYDSKLDLIKAVVKTSAPRQRFAMSIHVDSQPGSGLGSSSALTVSLLGAINRWMSRQASPQQIAEDAVVIERNEVGIKGGKQDQYAAAFGGFNLLEFKKDSVSVERLNLKKSFLNELLASVLICDTNATRLSSNILERQSRRYSKSNTEVMKSLDFIKGSAFTMRDCLLSGDMQQIGRLLHDGWVNKKRLDPEISNKRIDSLYDTGMANGAVGGKLMGAGGGGHLIFICDPDKREQVSKAMKRQGCSIVKINFDFDGLQVWKNADGKTE